jgi:hypothetical protein
MRLKALAQAAAWTNQRDGLLQCEGFGHEAQGLKLTEQHERWGGANVEISVEVRAYILEPAGMEGGCIIK